MIDKFVRSMADALDGVADGATVLIGGFGSVGQPDALIEGLIERGARDLIAEAVIALEFGAAAEDIARTCHAHPAMGETLQEAALAVAGRALHI